MCNLYRMEKAPDVIAALARQMGLALRYPEGVPNAEPRDLRITDRAPPLRAAPAEPGALEPEDCARWLDPATPAEEMVRALPGGSLHVEPAR